MLLGLRRIEWQVKGTSKVGARKNGSGLLKNAEASNWMVHVDLRDFLNRDLGIYISRV
jgi:hypothetical protein